MKTFNSVKVLFSAVVIAVFALCSIQMGVAAENKDAKVSIKAKGAPLADVLQKVKEQTGYTVDINEEWNDLAVKGNFNNVHLEKFLSRVFKGKNVSIITDDENKTYYVRLFGQKIGVKGQGAVASGGKKGNISGADPVIVDINALHEQQRRELREYKSNPDAKDPLSGMKLATIEQLHQDQKGEIENERNSAENQSINELHQQQRNEIKSTVGTKTASDPLSNMTVAEIQEINKRQSSELDRMRNDPNTVVDSETGMTLAELKALHDKQRQEFKELAKGSESQ